MGTTRILIVYQHTDFISKVLSNLFPTRFSRDITYNGRVDFIMTEEQNTIRISTQLGLSGSCGHQADEVYIESSLVRDDNKECLSSYGLDESHIHIINSRGL